MINPSSSTTIVPITRTGPLYGSGPGTKPGTGPSALNRRQGLEGFGQLTVDSFKELVTPSQVGAGLGVGAILLGGVVTLLVGGLWGRYMKGKRTGNGTLAIAAVLGLLGFYRSGAVLAAFWAANR